MKKCKRCCAYLVIILIFSMMQGCGALNKTIDLPYDRIVAAAIGQFAITPKILDEKSGSVKINAAFHDDLGEVYEMTILEQTPESLSFRLYKDYNIGFGYEQCVFAFKLIDSDKTRVSIDYSEFGVFLWIIPVSFNPGVFREQSIFETFERATREGNLPGNLNNGKLP